MVTEKKWVYKFNEGNAQMRELLGGKGANLQLRQREPGTVLSELRIPQTGRRAAV